MNRKKINFFVVLITPALLLAGIVVVTAFDLYAIRSVDPVSVHKDLSAHLARKEPISFPLPNELGERDPSKKTVFIFGESSLVISDGNTFPEYLGQDHADLRVVNFGVSGVDSFSVRRRVEEALFVERPDIIILYYGHNDYNNAYQGFIVPNYFQKFDCLMRLAYPFHDKNKPEGVLLPDEYYWFSRLNRPRLFLLFERLNMISTHSEDYARINQLILDYFILNNEAILEIAADRRVPVLLITPVGNLHAEPYGDLGTTTVSYRNGVANKDYLQSLRDLTIAKDSEILTYDLRAKSPLVDYLRHTKRSGVHVLDLQKELKDRRFGFGYGDFLDYFHFNDKSHRLVADIIYDYMSKNKLVGP